MKQLKFKILIAAFLQLFVINLAVAQDLWDGTTASSFYGGSGSESDPYQIRTGAELVYFTSLVNAGDDFSGKYVKLMNDIDMNRHSFSVTSLFAGTFDGGGNFITMMLGQPTNDNPFMRVSGRIHHLGVNIDLENEYNSVYYGDIQLVKNLLEGGILEDCYYNIQTGVRIFSYQEALVYNNDGIIQNCCAVGRFSAYGGYTTTTGSLLVYNNNATGVIENCFPYVNNGLTGYGAQLPIAFTNNGTIVHNSTNIDSLNSWVDEHPNHSRWTNETGKYRLVDFNGQTQCTIEFIDTLFNVSTPPIVRNNGEVVGELPLLSADCTFIGWNRFGKLVESEDIVNDDWMLFAKWEQRIRKQPIQSDMSIEVDDTEHASFTWYGIYGDATHLADWTPPKIGHGEDTTYLVTLQAYEGQIFQFDYRVSSEYADRFTFRCNGTVLLTASGEESNSFSYTIPSTGAYTFVFRYSKDDDTSEGLDRVFVTNIRLSNPENELDCYSSQLPDYLITQNGLYFCKIHYSNTGVVLTSDTVRINESYLDNVLQIVGASVNTDCLYTLPVNLLNHESIISVEFNLVLPNGITLEDKSLGERSEYFKRISEKVGDTVWYFKIWSQDEEPFEGNDGRILYLILGINDNVQFGNYPIELTNIEFVTNNGITLRPKNATIQLSIKPNGDMNNDGRLDISDVTSLIDYLLRH